MANLREAYTTQILPKLSSELGKNPFATPRIVKIAVNVGWGELKGNESLQKNVSEGLGIITGQKPVVTRAKKAIAGFKIRQNDIMGYRVTLRGERMYDFLDRIITYVLPRLRDFQGVSNAGFDKQGNYSFGLREQSVFPEIPYQSVEKPWGMQITIVTTAQDKEEAKKLLSAFGFPFAKKESK